MFILGDHYLELNII